MRRVNILTGIKQRINELLGTADRTSGDLTAWSIQSAMLSNFERVCKALTHGRTYGRIMSGLDVTGIGLTDATVSAGYGITMNGQLITVGGAFTYDMSGLSDDDYYLSVEYELIPFPGEAPGYPEGKESPVINESGTHQIVWDEKGSIPPAESSIISRTTNPATGITRDMVYIATVTITGGAISAISRSLIPYGGQVVVRGNPSQVLSTTVKAPVKFETVQADTSGEWDASGKEVYTARSRGWRSVAWKVTTTPTNTIWTADTTVLTTRAQAGGPGATSAYDLNGTSNGFVGTSNLIARESIGHALMYLEAGQTITIHATQNSGSDVTLSANAEDTFVTISTITED